MGLKRTARPSRSRPRRGPRRGRRRGGALTYGADSSRPSVASVSASGSRVTVAPVSAGNGDGHGDGDRHRRVEHHREADVPGGGDAAFHRRAHRARGDPDQGSAHFTELRPRGSTRRGTAAGLGRFPWTDSRLVARGSRRSGVSTCPSCGPRSRRRTTRRAVGRCLASSNRITGRLTGAYGPSKGTHTGGNRCFFHYRRVAGSPS